MSVYAVTGKLGNGKTLISVQKMEDAILSGRKVATNIDLSLTAMLSPKNKKARVIRVPDKPVLEDLEAIGLGYEGPGHDEEKFGWLVLDELGTWFNSRNWNDKTRQPLINWFLHARKKRWHILFLVQSEDVIDKQLRETLFEHVAHCRRLDKMRIPVITPLSAMLGVPIRFPKLHIAVVQLMLQSSSMIVDRWYSYGERCYSFYDTAQVFSPDYAHATYSVLPPGYLKRPPKTKWTPGKIMRYTKIQGKRYMRPMFIASVLIIGLLIGDRYMDSSYCNSMLEDCEVEPAPQVATDTPTQSEPVPEKEGPDYLVKTSDERPGDPFTKLAAESDYVQFQGIHSEEKAAGWLYFYPGNQRLLLSDVKRMGWRVRPVSGGLFLSRDNITYRAHWVDSPLSGSAGAGGGEPARARTTYF